jgi:hypothetical protein
MKTIVKTLLAVGLLSGAAMTVSAPAAAQPNGFSFRLGDIGFAYDDGYYDRSHRWHAWRHQRERDWYRVNYRNHYRGYNHDRDRDGVPDRMDRDRDNDGVPNRYDNRPNNPYRR